MSKKTEGKKRKLIRLLRFLRILLILLLVLSDGGFRNLVLSGGNFLLIFLLADNDVCGLFFLGILFLLFGLILGLVVSLLLGLVVLNSRGFLLLGLSIGLSGLLLLVAVKLLRVFFLGVFGLDGYSSGTVLPGLGSIKDGRPLLEENTAAGTEIVLFIEGDLLLRRRLPRRARRLLRIATRRARPRRTSRKMRSLIPQTFLRRSRRES